MTALAGARPRARLELGLAVAGKAAAAFGTIGFASLTPFVRDEFDLSSAGVGGIMGMIFVGGLVATIPGGALTDRVRAGRMLGSCLLLLAAALGLVAAAPSSVLFFLAIGVVGLAFGAGDPATNVLVSANVARRRRGLVMGVKQTGFTVGGALGGLVLPTIATAASWRVALVAPIAVCVAIGLCGLLVAGEPPHQTAEAREPARRAPLLALGSYGFLMAGLQVSTLGYLAVYLVDEQRLTETVAGLAVAVLLAGGTAGRIAWGLISDRLLHSRVLTLQLASLGAAAALAGLAVAEPRISLWPVLFALGFCAIGWNTVYVTVAAESVPPSGVGQATGTALFFSYAGGLSLPPLLGLVHDGAGSWLVTWLVATGVAVVALGVSRTRAAGRGSRAAHAQT